MGQTKSELFLCHHGPPKKGLRSRNSGSEKTTPFASFEAQPALLQAGAQGLKALLGCMYPNRICRAELRYLSQFRAKETGRLTCIHGNSTATRLKVCQKSGPSVLVSPLQGGTRQHQLRKGPATLTMPYLASLISQSWPNSEYVLITSPPKRYFLAGPKLCWALLWLPWKIASGGRHAFEGHGGFPSALPAKPCTNQSSQTPPPQKTRKKESLPMQSRFEVTPNGCPKETRSSFGKNVQPKKKQRHVTNGT